MKSMGIFWSLVTATNVAVDGPWTSKAIFMVHTTLYSFAFLAFSICFIINFFSFSSFNLMLLWSVLN
jgi:cytochrome b561